MHINLGKAKIRSNMVIAIGTEFLYKNKLKNKKHKKT